MPYVCENCGERDSFTAEGSCTRRYQAYGTAYVDGDGEVTDFDETDTDPNTESDDVEYDNVRCSQCQARALFCQSAEEADRMAVASARITAPVIVQAHNYTAGGPTALEY